MVFISPLFLLGQVQVQQNFELPQSPGTSFSSGLARFLDPQPLYISRDAEIIRFWRRGYSQIHSVTALHPG